MDEKILKIQADTEQAVTSVKDLRNALKEIKDAMAGLEEGSDAWIELSHQAGEYQHQLQAINESIRGASSDFGDKLGNIAKVGAGITGAFQTAQAALSLFGIESEEVTKSIKTMQDMMAMTQGLSAIDGMIHALPKLASGIKGTTIAAKALRAALEPKTFLAITAIITALVFVFNKLKAAQEAAAEAAKKAAQAIVNGNIQAMKSYDELTNRIKKLASDNENVLEAIYKHNVEMFDRIAKQSGKISDLQLKNIKKVYKEWVEAEKNAAKSVTDEEASLWISKAEDAKNRLQKWFDRNGIGSDVRQAFNNMFNSYFDWYSFNKKSYEKSESKDVKYESEIVDYTLQRLNLQKTLYEGTTKELEVIKQLVSYYGSLTVSDDTLEKQRQIVEGYRSQVELTEEEKEKAKEATDAYNALQQKQITSQEGLIKTHRDYVNTAASLLQNANSFASIQETMDKISSDNIIGADSAEMNNLKVIVEYRRQEISLLQKKTSLVASEPIKDLADEELQSRLRALFEVQKLLTKGTTEYFENVLEIQSVESQIRQNQLDKQMLQIEQNELINYQTKGEIQYLNEKLDILKSIAEETKNIYGEESLQYMSAIKNVKSLNMELEQTKYSAVNVANQGIGYISDMLSALAEDQKTNTREGFENQKKLNASATIMNGIAGSISAITSWMNPANAWMTAPVQAVMGTLQAAAVMTAASIQAKNILATQFDGGSSVSSGAVNSLTLVPPTQYTSAVQNANIEENTRSAKSYVAVTEIERVSNRVSVAEAESRY